MEEEGSHRRRYDNDEDDNDEDMDKRGWEGEGEGEGWWNDHHHTQHGQHPCLSPSNDDRKYNDNDILVIPLSNLGEVANHFLAVAVLLSAFSSPLSLLSRAVAVAAGQCSD